MLTVCVPLWEGGLRLLMYTVVILPLSHIKRFFPIFSCLNLFVHFIKYNIYCFSTNILLLLFFSLTYLIY